MFIMWNYIDNKVSIYQIVYLDWFQHPYSSIGEVLERCVYVGSDGDWKDILQVCDKITA